MYLVQNSKSKKGSFMVKQKSVAFIPVCSLLSPFSRGKTVTSFCQRLSVHK